MRRHAEPRPTIDRLRGAAVAAALGIVCAALTPAIASATPPADQADQAVRDDRVIGSIAGAPIHLSEVLARCDRALTVLALGSGPEEFKERAGRTVRGALRGLVVDRLVLADAEAALTDAERRELDRWTEEVRTKLVDRHGAGNPEVAEAELQDTLGWTLEETVRERRRAALTQRRYTQILEGKLTIGEDEITRDYERNIDRYTDLPRRTVRMIKTSDRAAADRIDHALISGTPFAEVASSPDNEFKRSRGGLFASPIRGDDGLVPPLARVVADLGVGARSDRIVFGGGYAWIMVEAITPGAVVPLAEARSDIESRLVEARRAKLMEAHVRGLVDRAEMTPFDVVQENAMRIIKRRFAEIAAAERTATGDRSPRPGR